jgi:hypothetical protein
LTGCFLDAGCNDLNTLFVKYEDAKSILEKCSVGSDSNKHEPRVIASEHTFGSLADGAVADDYKYVNAKIKYNVCVANL